MPFEIYKLCILLAFLQLFLQIAALVTESWFIAGKKGTGIGLFEINSKGDIFVGPSPAICFFIYMALSLFGCLCNVISIVYCIVEVFLSTRNQHRCFVKVQALIWFLSGVIAISLLIWMSKSVIHTEIGFDGTRREIHSGSSFYLGCGAAAANLFAAIVIISVNVNREIEDDTSRLNSEGPEVMMGPTGSRTTGNTSYPLNDIPGQSSLPLSGLSDTIPLEVSENASRMYFQTAIKEYPQTYTVVKPQRNTVTRGCPTEYKLPQDDPSYKYDQDPGNDFLSQY